MTDNHFMSVDEAAEILEYHRNHVYRLLHQGKLDGQKFGSGWAVSAESVAWAKAQQDEHGRVSWQSDEGTNE